MFSKLAIIASLAIFAVATPQSACSTGSLQCCESSGEADSAAIAPLLKSCVSLRSGPCETICDSVFIAFSSIGVVVQDVTALVGVTCSPITVSVA